MKKITFLLLFGFLWSLASFGQVPIGERDGTTSNMPIHGLYNYSYSQQIVYQSEINASGDINSISFYFSSGSTPTNSNSWTIYMAHTPKTQFSSNTDWVPGADFNQVYSGIVTYPAPGNVMQITFDSPFTYNNTDNLVIAVLEDSPGYSSMSFGKTATITGTNRGIYWSSDSVVPDPNSMASAKGRLNYINNMVLGGIQQSCPAPTDLIATGVSASTVDVSWTLGNSETSWNISWGTPGYTPGDANEVGSDISGATSFQITGLTADTNYAVYVQADCSGGDLSGWAGPLAVYTGYCIPVSTSTSDYLSSISSNGAVTNISYTASSMPTGGYSNQTALAFDSYETQVFNIVTDYVGGANGVNIWVDWNNNMQFDASELMGYQAGSGTKTFAITVPAGTPQGDYRMRVRGQYGSTANPTPCGSVSYGSAVDFTLTLVAPPSCLAPTNLATTAVGANTANITWTPSNTETSWNVSWGTPGYTPGDANEVGSDIAGATSYQINGLTPTTTYHVYVQADCGGGNESSWAGPLNLTTPCVPVLAPWSEDFENGGLIPDCWEQGASNGKPWKFSNTGAGNHIGNGGVITGSTQSGGYFAWVDDSATEYTNTTLISPFINVTALTNPELSFYLISNNEGNSNVDLSVDVFDGTAWNNGIFTNNSNTLNGGWEEITVDLSSLTITGNIQIRFVVDDVNNDFYDDVAIDDVSVHEQPSCPKPTDLATTGATPITADVSWIAAGTETSWNVSWGTPGYTPGDANELGSDIAGATSYHITGLTADTNYHVYVQADCGGGDESFWAGPLSVFTGYCTPSSTSTGDYLSGISSNGAVTNIAYTATSRPAGGYSNQTALLFESYETQTFNIVTDYVGGGNGVNIWVDWNNNMEFDSSELMGHLANGEGTKTFVITIPAGTPQGDYRMRVRGEYGTSADPAACGSVTFGSTVDFTLTLVAPPSCLAPTTLANIGMTFNTADISWVPSGTETSWNISWGTPGYTPGDTNELGSDIASATSYQITGLTADTGYDVYVQADCGGGDESSWTGPLELFTGYCTPSSTYTSDYLSAISSNGAVTDINYTATSIPTGGYSDQTLLDFESYMGQTFNIVTDYVGGANGVNIWVDWNNNMQFDASELMGYQTGSATKTFAITVPAGTPQGDYRMRVRAEYGSTANPAACGSVSFGSAVDFNLTLGAPPTCLEPTLLATTGMTSNTADITWTAGGTETSWNISWGTPGYTPGDANELGSDIAGATSYQITGLTADTGYDVYVQADCGGYESPWAGPLELFTGYCTPSSTYTSDYLSSISSNGAVTNITYTSSSMPTGGYSDQTALIIESYETQAFNIVTDYVGGTNGVNIWVDWNRDMEFDASELMGYQVGSGTKTFVVTVPAGLAQGDYRMRVRGEYGSSADPAACGSVSFGSAVDFTVSLVAPPSCLAPTQLAVSAMTFNTADITWAPSGTETSWNISWGTPGYTPGDANEIGSDIAGATPFQITGLTANTNYAIYVQADCGGGDLSSWGGPLAIYTGYCVPASTSSSDYLSEVSSNGAVTNISYTASSMPTGGYSDQTALLFESYETQTFNMVTNYVGGANGVKIWVDWNNNMQFDASELMGYQTGNTTKTFAVTVPAGTPQGDYRMRVRGQYGSSANPIPCGSVSFGSTIDFTLTIGTPPSCLAPTAFFATGVGAYTADVTWAPSGTEASWNVSWGTPGYTPGDANELGTGIAGAASYQITGLFPTTNYDAYVQADCGGGDESSWAGPLSFTTPCIAVVAPWSEDFENGGLIPDCWEQGASNGKPWKFSNTGSGNHIGNNGVMTGTTQSGGYFAWVDDSATEYPNTTLISPLIDVSALTIPELTFYLISHNEGHSNVNLSVDIHDGAAWNNGVFTNNSNTANGGWEEITVNLSSLTITGNIQIRFVVDDVNNDFYDDVAIDDVSVHEQPTCPKPSDLIVANVTENSADISWTPVGSETQWEVLYGETGFDPNTAGDTETVNTNPGVTLNTLIPSTGYDVYVRAVCGVGDVSDWLGPVFFRTSCVPGAIPFFESFESGYTNQVALGGCWSQESLDGSDSWTVNSSLTTYNRSPRTGSFSIYLEYGNEDWIFYPLNLTGGIAYQLKFYAKQDASSGASVQAAYGTSDNSVAMTNSIIASSQVTSGAYQEFSGFFTPASSGIYYIGIKGTLDFTPWYLSIDDISVEEAGGCLMPSDLTVTNVSQDSADLSWTESGTATQWEVLYGEAGFDPNTAGTTETVNTIPEVTINGLLPNTDYDFYVTAICGVDESGMAGPKIFTTLCDSTTVPYMMDFETAVVPDIPPCTTKENAGTGNEWVTQVYNQNGMSGNVLRYGYNTTNPANAWFYTQGIELQTGVNYEISYKYFGSSTWPEKMKVAYGTTPHSTEMTMQLADYPSIGSAGNDMIVFTVGADGVYYFGFNVYSDANQNYLYVDDINIVEGVVACDPVTDVTISDVEENGATVSWTASPTAINGYEVNVFLTGVDPNTGTPEATETVAAGVTTVVVTGLDANTTYDVYVISDCGGGDTAMSSVVTFTTLVIGIDDNNLAQVRYFPNPVKDELTITAARVIENVTVYNLLGQPVLKVQPKGLKVVLDMSSLPSGTYVLKANVTDAASTFKVIKE